MGIFANDTDGGGWMAPKPARDGVLRHEFDALGHPVPAFRRENANAHLKAMGVQSAELRHDCIGRMSSFIERDNPHYALECAAKYVDVTGAYRLLAALLTGEPPMPLEATE